MKPSVFAAPPPLPRRRNGVAIVIILAFVVLLTGLVVAFLAMSTTGRQVASSSANQARTDLFIRGMVDVTLGDLKQEIAAGSTLASPATGVTIYTPKTPATAVPTLAGTTGTTGLENLVKRSAFGVPFYLSGSNYDSATYPASSRAANVSTLTPSQNGRFISPARWNKALLLAKANPASDTDFTPVGATAATGSTSAVWPSAPDWILVSRSGANPTAWDTSLKFTATGANTVIGRYAYAIYDEGGLLDMNVAGSPPVSDISNDVARKSSLAFADLTQLPSLSGTSLSTANQQKLLSDIVGWRNYVTAGVAGGALGALSDPGTGYTITSGSTYRDFLLSNTTGFLTTGNLALSGSTSDRMFNSRQEMMSFLLQGIGSADTPAIRAALQNALQYMGTFSRDLNQPSLAPNPDRPKIASNTAADNYAGNDAGGKGDLINPSFLTVRVATPFTRNDGTPAAAGDPLVNKRFALNHLAWLTYQGPSAPRSGNTGDPDIQALLAPGTGITAAFLQQGTAENIQKYFGLTWSSAGYWTYLHGGGTKILTLSEVAAANREPDFIELLKASINAGAIAKGATNPTGITEEQGFFNNDTIVDRAILQIAANIIDQFDCDGFPTRLRFTNTIKLMEFRGVENLPYFYRIRNGTILAGLPDPLTGGSAAPLESTGPLNNTGLYVSLYEPEVWNPHDRNSSVGNPRPTALRLVADGALLDANGDAADPALYNTSYSITEDLSQGIKVNKVPSLDALYDISKTPTTFLPLQEGGGAISKLTADSTELDFTDNGGALFREPTLLTKPGIPAGSNLQMGPNHALRTVFGDHRISAYFMSGPSGDGIQCWTDPLSIGTPTPYIGMYRAEGPLRWVTTGTTVVSSTDAVTGAVTSQPVVSSTNFATAYYLSYTNPTSGVNSTTFRMQYKAADGNWTTYDEKLTYPTDLVGTVPIDVTAADSNTIYNATKNSPIGYIGWSGALDPRTVRFGVSNASGIGDNYAGGNGVRMTIWTDENNNMLSSYRPAAASGMGGSRKGFCLPNVGGWNPNPLDTWIFIGPNSASGPFAFRYGLLSQNDPAAISNGTRSYNLLYSNTIDNYPFGTQAPQYYTDPDGVSRRAMGAYVPSGGGVPANTTFGLPMASTVGPAGSKIFANQSQSRPIILNRPFRSVAELGYVFSDTPWKNLSFFTPESGYSGMLDVFCIQDNGRPDAMVAGKVDLNTRQKPVLKAILAGAYADELSVTSTTSGVISISGSDAGTLADSLVARTTGTAADKGPLANISELVGRWNGFVNASLGGIDGGKSYTGFSDDLSAVYTATAPAAAAVTVPVSVAMHNIQRFREAPIRALSANGTARVWNLMIDVVAQTGRYPANASSLSNFMVEGEQRLWVHVAIDRYTGKIIDRSVEVVKE